MNDDFFFSLDQLQAIAEFMARAQPENAYQLYKDGQRILVQREPGQAAQTRLFTPGNHPDAGRIERRRVKTGSWPRYRSEPFWVPPYRD